MSDRYTDADLEQLVLFEGMRVNRVRCKIQGVKDFDSILGAERTTIKPGDTGTLEIGWVCVDVRHPEKHDATGVATGPLTRTQILQAIDGTQEIRTIKRREERQKEWREHVTAGTQDPTA